MPRTNGCSNAPDGPLLNACNGHDICYDNLNVGKSGCDNSFKNDMSDICDYKYRTSGRNKICKGTANTYYTAVVIAGNSAYYTSQSEATCASWWGIHEAFCK